MTSDGKARGHQTQWAAQFAVASELCKRGYEVAFTSGHTTPVADLMAVSPVAKTMFLIDVKGLYTSIIIAPILSLLLGTEPPTTLTDPVGHLWQAQDIRSVAALVSLFTALPFWLVAVFKIAGVAAEIVPNSRWARRLFSS